MSTTQSASRNGVDTEALFATLEAVKESPEIARFQFRASNRWISGTHNRSTINRYYGAGQEHARPIDFEYDADHPPVLLGEDNGPAPVEHLLHALAACLTSGLVNIAAARGIELEEVTSTVEGDINLLGIFGLDDDIRNGYEAIRIVVHIKGDAEAAKLEALVKQSRNRSAVFDVLTNGVPISVSVATA